MDIRYWWAAQKAKAGEVVLLHKETGKMLADMHTKPVGGELFQFLSSGTMGERDTDI